MVERLHKQISVSLQQWKRNAVHLPNAMCYFKISSNIKFGMIYATLTGTVHPKMKVCDHPYVTLKPIGF